MSLLNNAIKDYETSKILYDLMKKENSDFHINNVCYHLQQCMEKNIKYLLELAGVRYERIHDIFELSEECINVYKHTDMISDKDVKYKLAAVLNQTLEKANAYTSWESKSRYYDGFKELNKNIEEAFFICGELINIIQIIEQGE